MHPQTRRRPSSKWRRRRRSPPRLLPLSRSERRARRRAPLAARDFERKASKLATKKREAEELAALHADRVAAGEIAELAEREALEAETAGKEALKVQQKVDRDTRYAARKARQRKGR